MRDLFHGQLVRITAEEPGANAKAEVRWQSDSEFHRLSDNWPAKLKSEKKFKEQFEKKIEDGFAPRRYSFSVRTLAEDKHIGFIVLVVDLINNEGWVGIGIGERDFWDKGYGSDMMRLCLQYAFTEVNVHRVSLGVIDYNPRAMRVYEKAGFQLEGTTREDIFREGRRADSLWMGILRDEWIQIQNGA